MGEQNQDEGKTTVNKTSLEDLLKVKSSAATPDFDPKDEDVFDLELDPEVTAGLFSNEPEEFADLLAERVADDKAAVHWRNQRRFVMESGRHEVVPAAPAAHSRPLPERALIGLLVVNALLIGVFLVVPEVFDVLTGAGRAPESTRGRAAPVVHDSVPVAGPMSNRRPPERPHALDANAMPDGESYEAAQHWIGRGHYDKATSMLQAYLASHPRLTLLQRQAVFSSLLYCAQQLGDTKRATAHLARVESLRQLAASPEDLWAEASAARAGSRGAETRRLHARLLLQSGRLQERWEGTDRVDAAHAAFGDSYRFAARDAGKRAKGGKVIR